jgi:hypothetical protein
MTIGAGSRNTDVHTIRERDLRPVIAEERRLDDHVRADEAEELAQQLDVTRRVVTPRERTSACATRDQFGVARVVEIAAEHLLALGRHGRTVCEIEWRARHPTRHARRDRRIVRAALTFVTADGDERMHRRARPAHHPARSQPRPRGRSRRRRVRIRRTVSASLRLRLRTGLTTSSGRSSRTPGKRFWNDSRATALTALATSVRCWYLARLPERLAPEAQVAQLVEQRTENPRVGGSIPSLGTTFQLTANLAVRRSTSLHVWDTCIRPD